MNDPVLEIVPAPRPIQEDEAQVNITYNAQNGDLPDPVAYDTSDARLKMMLVEAISTGTVPGIRADQNVDLSDFVVDRFEASNARPYRAIFVRPKTAFGA